MQKWQDKYEGSIDAQWCVVEVEVSTDVEGVEDEDGGQKKGYMNNVALYMSELRKPSSCLPIEILKLLRRKMTLAVVCHAQVS